MGNSSTSGARAGGDARVVNRSTDTDRHVGIRIRERRVMLGLSQQLPRLHISEPTRIGMISSAVFFLKKKTR